MSVDLPLNSMTTSEKLRLMESIWDRDRRSMTRSEGWQPNGTHFRFLNLKYAPLSS